MAKILIIETDKADNDLINNFCTLLTSYKGRSFGETALESDSVTILCGITFHPDLLQVAVGNEEAVTLLPSEYKILHLLAVYEGQIVSHEEICQIVGSPHRRKKSPPPIIAANYIMHLRKKMGFDFPGSRYRIESVKKIGYRLLFVTEA